MKSFWDKATEIGTKAKSLATGYLGTERLPKKDIDEQEKNFVEKFLTLKTEIEEFKRDTIKAAEEKLKTMADKIKISNEEKETVKISFDEQVLCIEAAFCEKDKNYLVQLNNFEKKMKFKDLHIEKLENSVKEMNEEIKGYQEKENEFKSNLEHQETYKNNEQSIGLNALSALFDNLNKTKESIIRESQLLYEIDLEKIRAKVDIFFTEIKLDFTSLNINTENANFDENLKNEFKSLSENINVNLDLITKLIKTVKNELFLVLKNKVESIKKDSASKLDAIKTEISNNFDINLNLINGKINELKTFNDNNNAESKNVKKMEKEIKRLNKEMENYIVKLTTADNDKDEFQLKNNESENIINVTQEKNRNYAIKINEIENSLKEKENLILNYSAKLSEKDKSVEELNAKLINLNYLNDKNKKLIEERESNENENKKRIEDLNNLVLNLENKINNLKNKINELEDSLKNLQENNSNEINDKINELENEKKELEEKLTSADNGKSEVTEKCEKFEKELEDLNKKLEEMYSAKKTLENEKLQLENNLINLNNKHKEENENVHKNNNNNKEELIIKIKGLECKINELEKEKIDLAENNKKEIDLIKHDNEKAFKGLENEKETLDKKIKELEFHKEDLNKKIMEFEKIKTNGNNANSTSISNYNTTNKGKGKKKNNLNSNNNQNKTNNANDQFEYNAYESNNKAAEIEKKTAEITEKLEEAQVKNETLLKEISKMEESLETAFKTSNEFSHAENNLRNEVSEKHRNIEEKEEKITELNNLLANLNNEFSKIKEDQIAEKQKNSAEEKDTYEKEIKTLNDKINKLENLNKLKEEDINKLITEEEKLTKEIIDFKAEIEINKNREFKAIETLKKLKYQINELKLSLEKVNNHNAQLKEAAENFEKIKSENNELKEKVEKLSHERQDLYSFKNQLDKKEEQINEIKTKKEAQANLEITELKKQIENLNNEDNINKTALEKLTDENSNLNSALSNMNIEKSQALQVSESLKQTIKTCKLTFKQFFLMLLDDDIFIDLIQKTFSEDCNDQSPESLEKSSQLFFEKVYSLSKYIKPKIILSFIKLNCKNLQNLLIHNELSKIFNKKLESIGVQLNNESKSQSKLNKNNNKNYKKNNFAFEKIKKIASENNLILNSLNQIEELSEAALNLQQLEKLDSELNEIEAPEPNSISMALADFILELQYNLEFLANYSNSNLKKISEINSHLKSAKETLEDSKKHEAEKYEILNKNIQKLQQECRDLSKTEKLLKENLESTENSIKDAKSENEKLTNKQKTLNNLYEELNSERKNLIEKNLQLMQQMENFRIENMEITEKSSQREILIKSLYDKVDLIHKEKAELSSQIAELRKLSEVLNEKNLIMQNKEREIEKMRQSYSELEEFIESLKIEKEQSLEMVKKQIYELNSELEDYKELLRENEEKISAESADKYEESDKIIVDLQLENKFLKDQKNKMKKYSEEILIKVKNDLKDTEFLVDKRMISNILVKYFDKNTNEGIKKALLDTLANFMGLSNEERAQIGLYVCNANIVNSSGNKNDKLKELSDDLYNFILNA